jgi:hypothetical protein
LIKKAFQEGEQQLLVDCIDQTTGGIQNRLLEANYYWKTLDGELITLNKYYEADGDVAETDDSDADNEDAGTEIEVVPEAEFPDSTQTLSFIPPKERD